MPMWLIVVLCGAMLIVYAHVMHGKRRLEEQPSNDDQSESWLDAVSTTLQSMFDEWTTAHEALKKDVAHAQQQWEANTQTMMRRIDALQQAHEAHVAMMMPPVHKSEPHIAEQKNDAGRRQKKPIRTTPTTNPQDNAPVYAIRSKFDELLTLHEEGKSIEYIAKKLNKNKGEVQLIIRLAQTEGA
ncbi:MAG: hypothetical protein KGO83_02795 [Paenibacillaceae bacterium]|nr:hypothetical protein [Paenibacillaceae bacterium]